MITLGAVQTFHARCDLPAPAAPSLEDEALDELGDTLLRPVLRHGVDHVVLVLYTADRHRGERVAAALRRRLARAEVEVLATLRADGSRWWTCPAGSEGVPADGVPYDITAHPFLAESVVRGRVTHATRADLADLVAAVPEQVREVETALAEAGRRPRGRLDADLERLRRAADLVGSGRPLVAPADPAEVAALLDAVGLENARDLVLRSIDRDSAPEHVAVWSAVLRGAPPRHVGTAGLLLAWAAWQAGDGALAWCGLDRVAEVDDADPMAALLEQVLIEAVPPSAVDDLWAGLDDLEALEEERWWAEEHATELGE